MSERDSVHKEIEKLQEDLGETKKKMTAVEGKSKGQEEEVRKSIHYNLSKKKNGHTIYAHSYIAYISAPEAAVSDRVVEA